MLKKFLILPHLDFRMDHQLLLLANFQEVLERAFRRQRE